MNEIRRSVGRVPGAEPVRYVAAALCACVLAIACVPGIASGSPRASQAREHFACNHPNSAHVPCHFSTPSGNVHCVWIPSPNTVTCELLAGGRAYRLRPSGKSSAIKTKLPIRGETLPTNQQLTLPNSLSCHDTRTSITCNQDFATGAFKLAPQGSHHS